MCWMAVDNIAWLARADPAGEGLGGSCEQVYYSTVGWVRTSTIPSHAGCISPKDTVPWAIQPPSIRHSASSCGKQSRRRVRIRRCLATNTNMQYESSPTCISTQAIRRLMRKYFNFDSRTMSKLHVIHLYCCSYEAEIKCKYNALWIIGICTGLY